MFEPYEIAERIKNCAKEKNMTVKSLLQDAGVGEKMVSNMSGKNGSYPQSDKIAQIAKVLNCSVDYLLGCTDNPNVTGGTYINGDNNNSGQQAINGNINLSAYSAEQDDKQLLELIKSLDLVERSKIITQIDEMKNKK
jgi:transcriptional regulator with XRE-family HTH domain